MSNTVQWDEPMIAAMQELRSRGLPLLVCAEVIGVCYPQAVYKARELNLAGRMNRGNIPGVLARATIQNPEGN